MLLPMMLFADIRFDCRRCHTLTLLMLLLIMPPSIYADIAAADYFRYAFSFQLMLRLFHALLCCCHDYFDVSRCARHDARLRLMLAAADFALFFCLMPRYAA